MENFFAGQPELETHSVPTGNFPGWRYHPTGASRIVQSQEELERLGPDWRDVPYPPSAAAEFSQQSETSTPAKPCESCKRLVSENAAMKLRFDNAYGDLKQHHDALQEQRDLLATTNAVLTRQNAELLGKAQAFEAAGTPTPVTAPSADTPQTETPVQTPAPPAPPAAPAPAGTNKPAKPGK